MADSREGAGQKHFRKHCCSVHNLCTLEMQRIPLIASETPWGGPSEPCPRLLPPARSYWGSLLPLPPTQPPPPLILPPTPCPLPCPQLLGEPAAQHEQAGLQGGCCRQVAAHGRPRAAGAAAARAARGGGGGPRVHHGRAVVEEGTAVGAGGDPPELIFCASSFFFQK